MKPKIMFKSRWNIKSILMKMAKEIQRAKQDPMTAEKIK